MWTITFFSCWNPEKWNCCLEPSFELLTTVTWNKQKQSFKTYTARLLQKLQYPPPSPWVSCWWKQIIFQVAPQGIYLSSQSLLSSLYVHLTRVQQKVPNKYLQEMLACLVSVPWLCTWKSPELKDMTDESCCVPVQWGKQIFALQVF